MKCTDFTVLLVTSLFMLSGTLISVAPAEGEELWAPDELIVKFIPGSSASQKSALISGFKIKDLTSIGAEVWHVNGQPVEDAVAVLNGSPIVDYAEPNYLLHLVGIPGDSGFGMQWNMHNTGQTIDGVPGIADADIDAPEAWDLYTGSSSAVVAVLDTGVDYTHPDLAANIWHNVGEIAGNLIDDDANGYIDDVRGWNFYDGNNDVSDANVSYSHGTHCSGIIGAVGDNGEHVAGVNWDVTIMPVRCFSPAGGATVDDVVNAIDYAVAMGADVINASFGFAEYALSLQLAIERAQAGNVFFVAAAGNDDRNIDLALTFYPAGFATENIISVMATDNRDERPEFSNYGAMDVDIGAPGWNVPSTARGDTSKVLSGTSMAAPHVSGAVAMLRGLSSDITVEQGKSLLLELGNDALPSLAGLCVSGGRLNLRKLVEAPDATAPAQIADLAVGAIGSSWIELNWTATGDDGPVGRALAYDVRFATSAIVTESDWGAARRAAGAPAPQASGAPDTMRVAGLTASTTYYFAIRALDEVNRGAISNCPSGMTLEPPTIAVAPTSLSVTLAIGGSTSRNLQIANVGEGTVDYRIGRPPAWLSVAPNAGSVAAGDSTDLTLTFDSAGVPVGIHAGVLRIVSNDPASPIVVVPLTLDVVDLPPLAATVARYAIASGSTDTTTVFAVEVLPGPDADSVTVDVSGLNALGILTLRDDGAGEDSIAGDRVYTSERFQANVLAGTYTVDVTCTTAGGAFSKQEVSVEAVANKAKFIDVSSATGALYEDAPQDTTMMPYSSVHFRATPSDSAAANILIVTIDDNVTEPLFLQEVGSLNGAPQYDRAWQGWLGARLPAGSRGVSFSDFDNDGDNDFFVCGLDSAVLYENRLDEVEGQFVNVTAAAFGAARSQMAGSLAASWGDYNRDGFLDLVVTTTNYDGAMRLLTDAGSYDCETLVFRNKRDGSFALTGFGGFTSGNVTPASCWVDLDRDGDPELVLGRMVGEYPIVLDNTGYSVGAGDAELVAGNWATTGVASGANSVTVIDYDHDPYPDLLVTEVAGGRAVILQNNYDGSPSSKSFTPIELAASGSWTGAVVADFDLDGQEDHLLLPRAGVPALYMADAYGTTPTYRDLAYTLGLRSGGVGGAIAGDFNNDHDPDLYLGRLKTDQFQYKNVRQNLEGGDEPAAGQKWLAVQLNTTGSSNGGLIGTEVSVRAGSQRWTQHVDGGSGRGGQRPGRLLFGLGDIAQNQVTVVARYPSGERDSVSVAVNTAITLEENEAVALKAGTKNDPEPDFDFELQPGSMNWVFKWRSTNVRGDLRRDKVHVQNYRQYPLNSACSLGIDEGDTLDLLWGDPGVGHLVYWDGSLWQHEVRWGGLLCYPGCDHRFSVTSASDAASSATSGLRVTTPTALCLPDMEQ